MRTQACRLAALQHINGFRWIAADESEEMPVEFKDYYDVLGVARNASDADIKKAFRNLARKYHPDVARNKTVAESKFKEINEANEVLSDPDKRKKYDELGVNWNRPGQQTTQQEQDFQGRSGAGSEYHFDGTGFSDFFEQFFGSRGRPSGAFHRTRGPDSDGAESARNGQDVEGDILVTLDEVLHGSSRMIKMQRTDPRTGQSSFQTIRVAIPAGVQEKQLVRLAGKGQEGLGGGTSGHLYLRITLARHPDFRTRGANLYFDLDLAPWEAVLGCTVHIPTLDGAVALKIPAGTVAGRQFRLRGKGLPTGTDTRADLHAVVSIQVPPELTSEQRRLWEQLADQYKFNPRKA